LPVSANKATPVSANWHHPRGTPAEKRHGRQMAQSLCRDFLSELSSMKHLRKGARPAGYAEAA
jgi:hypothetical protein